MISIWSAIYIIPLAAIWGISIGKQNKDYIIITSASMVAYFFTRVISEKVTGDRYFYDLANDFFVIAVMLGFIGVKRPIVILLMATYASIIFFAYIPYSEGLIVVKDSFIIVEVIGKIQLILLIIGIYHSGIRSYCSQYYKSSQSLRSFVELSAKLYVLVRVYCSRRNNNKVNMGNRNDKKNISHNYEGNQIK